MMNVIYLCNSWHLVGGPDRSFYCKNISLFFSTHMTARGRPPGLSQLSLSLSGQHLGNWWTSQLWCLQDCLETFSEHLYQLAMHWTNRPSSLWLHCDNFVSFSKLTDPQYWLGAVSCFLKLSRWREERELRVSWVPHLFGPNYFY